MKLYTSKQAAEFLNVAVSTIIRWDNEGKIHPLRTPGGHRRFTEEELQRVLGIKAPSQPPGLRAALYGRVSTKKQQDTGNLDRQMERLREHAREQGYKTVVELSETASGVNENRAKLHRLLRMIRDGQVDIVVVEYKDRLARFGYRYLERYIADFGAVVDVLEDQAVNGNTHEELVKDLIAIVTSFSARIYGARGASVVKRVKKALQDEDDHTDTNT
jgi:excisionase family DNA binding protein